MSADEAAEALGVPVSTVSRWARVGKLPAIKTLAGRWRFRRSDIEAHVRELDEFRQAAS